jgi:hypothetical protein
MTTSTRNWSRLLDLIDAAVPAAASARRTATATMCTKPGSGARLRRSLPQGRVDVTSAVSAADHDNACS